MQHLRSPNASRHGPPEPQQRMPTKRNVPNAFGGPKERCQTRRHHAAPRLRCPNQTSTHRPAPSEAADSTQNDKTCAIFPGYRFFSRRRHHSEQGLVRGTHHSPKRRKGRPRWHRRGERRAWSGSVVSDNAEEYASALERAGSDACRTAERLTSPNWYRLVSKDASHPKKDRRAACNSHPRDVFTS